MPLDIPNGERFFLDANILYYCFVETPPHSEMCRQLLARVQNGELTALTDARALADCVHKTMLAEVSERYGRSRERLMAGSSNILKCLPSCRRRPKYVIGSFGSN
jgi:predicted nucleic acid-binding protein